MGIPPRLIDLSVARPSARWEIRNPIGTDAYMAPEQCGPGQVSPACDIWGLGATLHHAVSGSVPFPRSHGDDRFPQLRDEPLPLPGDAAPALRELIDAMLAFDPADRPTAAEVVARLEPLIEALPRRLAFAKRGTRSPRA
jgi:serine/threonine protein kinase